ncbi:bifunctional hydroxymethylpyrimidine kinase/phosphomethylpyrimidine kinase [Fluoribacter gormanii]|uniref:hydroxymethylpyrimidine kinase n=1 Tax=Fluoribacter gormanii TaxID=464 RepID=A0A377GKA5_9GAMM|nr:bifunctional hydroxymethylpyrimidine kinase/phosphomethylpyrimidine kinase [Fluoribacter gormanii]KTD02561.1 bifunctional hydroxy-methylpyrimidine kinase and hydroxy-phosphomethylpyrimidine kinase [Fluoribacter gormanii]MCW8443218.1 bifunctional hydroxymethylpyrimidine kinase/phosphomethylpyrimidine kinase [Fluoribacter gormanii]MCW8471641.1 bifunctional hydroxymethylpyrimidine kinase/phosphomethylpyrimidine kinase [Fluoribacter gormanii]SIR43365.1 hydroxymethylpyrimidine/phosphomethylpyrimi
MRYKALSIAGFDGSGGAGIQADLKTFSALGCYGMTVLTALPVQNTCGVRHCYTIPLQAIEDQLNAIFDDIKPDSIKIGMLFNNEIIELVSSFLKRRAIDIPVVIDPVTVAKSGDPLLLPEAVNSLIAQLMPLATLITPNLPEASTFTGAQASSEKEMLYVGQKLLEFGPKYVLLKGGHLLHSQESNDLLIGSNGDTHWFSSPRINSKNTHGTGCTLSAAITACLAQKMDLISACSIAKNYLFNAIQAAKENCVGLGNGPVHHFYHLWPVQLSDI